MKKYEVTVNGQSYQVTLREVTAEEGQQFAANPKAESAPAPAPQSTGTVVQAPMAGTVLSINVKVGEAVKKGQTLLMLEAMKMENEIVAPEDGVVSAIHVSANQAVESNQTLVSL